MRTVYFINVIGNVDLSFYSISTFILVLLFLEFCVFCYFTPNLFVFFRGRNNLNSDLVDDTDEFEDDGSSLVVSDNNEVYDDDYFTELPLEDDNDLGSLVFPEQEWEEDDYHDDKKETYSILLELNPGFKIDEFYEQIYHLYANILERYTEDDLRDVSHLMIKELYQKNVKQLDYFRRNNLKHIVSVSEFLSCQILKCQIIEKDVYIKLELKTNSYDYIINKATDKVVRGIGNRPLYCVNHLILKRKIDITRTSSNPLTDKLLASSLPVKSSIDNENWILVDNKIIRRRSK